MTPQLDKLRYKTIEIAKVPRRIPSDPTELIGNTRGHPEEGD